MLVLSRKVGQKILIGDQIEVTVVRVAQGTVRIGVEAPDNFTIVRHELAINDVLTEDDNPQNEKTTITAQATDGKIAAISPNHDRQADLLCRSRNHRS